MINELFSWFQVVFVDQFDWWVVWGLAAQFMFMMRFVVQWLASERAKRSIVPIPFWFFSIGGGLDAPDLRHRTARPGFHPRPVLGLIIYSHAISGSSLPSGALLPAQRATRPLKGAVRPLVGRQFWRAARKDRLSGHQPFQARSEVGSPVRPAMAARCGNGQARPAQPGFHSRPRNNQAQTVQSALSMARAWSREPASSNPKQAAGPSLEEVEPQAHDPGSDGRAGCITLATKG
jgi:hypothetical protein